MIRWLVESIDAYPDLVCGRAPAGLLGAPEQQELAAFKVLKRRQDWLLGRWTAKNLVQTHLAETRGEPVPLDQIWINYETGGAPYITLNGTALAGLLPVSLSISHSQGHAFCALYDAQWDAAIEQNARVAAATQITIGADIEYIEPREPGFVTAFLTASETSAVNQASLAQRDRLVTALWSAKEAVFKALRVGLQMDPQTIHCNFMPLPPLAAIHTDWHLLTIERRGSLSQTAPADKFSGWWRTVDNFVLTLVLRSS